MGGSMPLFSEQDNPASFSPYLLTRSVPHIHANKLTPQLLLRIETKMWWILFALIVSCSVHTETTVPNTLGPSQYVHDKYAISAALHISWIKVRNYISSSQQFALNISHKVILCILFDFVASRLIRSISCLIFVELKYLLLNTITILLSLKENRITSIQSKTEHVLRYYWVS